MSYLDTHRIKQILDDRRLNHTNLADKIGVERSTVSSWLNGRIFPSEENLSKLAHQLDMEPDELILSEQPSVMVQSPNNHIHFNSYYNYSINNIIVPKDSAEFEQLMNTLFKQENPEKPTKEGG